MFLDLYIQSLVFGYFTKSIRKGDIAKFSRDSAVKYTKQSSYKIENENYSDALFYQRVKVLPNTNYRVTCMAKTHDVKNLHNTKSGGAQISIPGSSEKSENIYGDNDWTKLELMFNSKNREEVNIAFRLGGFDDKSKGTAYFTDFKMEIGSQDIEDHWKFACFIFENTDADYIENRVKKHTKAKIEYRNREDVYDDMNKLKKTIKDFSKGRMEIEYDIITIKDPIKTLSLDEDNGYYIDAYDVIDQIKPYLEKGEYDHFFLAGSLGDVNINKETKLPIWVGLGGMDYNGIGYSNIRLSQVKNDYTMRYDTRINIFPEEVFLHEFLHTLERNAIECGYDIPALHDNEKYGYFDEKYIGLRDWYKIYMRKEIKTKDGKNIGLPEEIYRMQPPHKSNFKRPIEIEEIKETTNIIEEILSIIERTKYMFNKIDHQELEQTVVGEV